MSKTGLDGIIEQIIGDAERDREEILRKAEREAEEIVAAAELEAERISKDCEREAAKSAEELLRRADSSGELEYRNRILAAKQSIISGMLKTAEKELFRDGYDDYIELIAKMSEEAGSCGNGEIVFSAADIQNMPDVLAEKCKELGLAVREGSLSGRGFILRYGGIEMNCTAKALVEEHREELTDMLGGFLFGGGVDN